MSSWAALKGRAGALAPSMSKAGEDERDGDDERKPLKAQIEGSSDTGAGPCMQSIACLRRSARFRVTVPRQLGH